MLKDTEYDRFWSKVARSAPQDCWLWQGHVMKNGYGQYRYLGQTWLAHRAAYHLTHAKLSRQAVVMHSCDNRQCVNPAHLSVGTQKDNIQDAIAKGRMKRNPGAKLTPQQVQDIRARWEAGEGQRALAREYGVHRNTVHYICNNRTWADAS